MSSIRYVSSVRYSLTVVVLVACGAPFGTAQVQEKKPATVTEKKETTSVPALPAEVHTFPLRHARAYEVAELLNKIFADTRMQVVSDDRTNSLLVRVAAVKFAEIRNLVDKLEIEAADTKPVHKISVYSLRSIEPDDALEAGLKVLFKGSTGNFAIDRARKTVIVSANQATTDIVETVLAKLEVLQKERPAQDMQIRVVWLVNSTEKADADDTPALALPAPGDDLKEVLPGLAKLGIAEPRVAAQFFISAKSNRAFQASGTERLYRPVDIMVSGHFGDSREMPDMRISIEVSADSNSQGFRAKKGGAASPPEPPTKKVLSHLETNISAPPGHLVVLGVTPMNGMTSAFVVQVQGERNRKEGARK
ncbi:MAG TPA: secretin N-terminal domain-containing protein [Gemmataceae bacterium]|jgi:hypothetical protein|nr:secretin N-terminal domain-containing protein [Gemmataceae bacterium]